MARFVAFLRYIVAEFGPLVIFWGLTTTVSLKAGIGGSILFILAGVAWRLWKGQCFTRLYILIAVLTVIFGSIDLLSVEPSMIIYESVLTNVITGVAFIVGAFGKKPMLQEMAEQRASIPFPDRADMRRFFQIFTLIWAAYFFIKAGCYFWMARVMPLTEAMTLRTLVGGTSLGLMIALSITQGKRLFKLCRKLGLLPLADSDCSRQESGA